MLHASFQQACFVLLLAGFNPPAYLDLAQARIVPWLTPAHLDLAPACVVPLQLLAAAPAQAFKRHQIMEAAAPVRRQSGSQQWFLPVVSRLCWGCLPGAGCSILRALPSHQPRRGQAGGRGGLVCTSPIPP